MKKLLIEALEAYKKEYRVSMTDFCTVSGLSRKTAYVMFREDGNTTIETYINTLDRLGISVVLTIDASKSIPAHQLLNEMEKQ